MLCDLLASAVPEALGPSQTLGQPLVTPVLPSPGPSSLPHLGEHPWAAWLAC